MKLHILIKLSLVFFVASTQSQSLKWQVLSDSIQKLVTSSKDDSFDEIQRFEFAKRANALAKEFNNDSIYLSTNINLLNFYFQKENFEAYVNANHKIIKLSNKLNDSLSSGQSHYAIGYAYSIQKLNDSSYYYFSKAAKIFDGIGNKRQLSYSLGSLSVIQLNGKDYFGADENAVLALKALEDLDENDDILDQKWILYNTLGSVANALNNYDKALEYHSKALESARRMTYDFNNGIYSLNNIAFVKREQGHLDEAIKILIDISERKNLIENDPSFYALILENLAYTRYLKGSYNKDKIVSLFDKSYAISDSINDVITKTGTVISMAKFYQGIGEKANAEAYAREAYQLSKDIQSNEIFLESMKLLSELKDGDAGKAYLYEYIKVSDSLLTVERNVRNKFARIELETDLLEAKNKQISKENLYLLILSMGLLLTAILVYVVISQRAKNRKLKLIQVQQKANEDIYNLLLGQQDKVDEARAKEKIRVSKELHDGVLGRLFGTRLSLDSMNFKEGKEAMMTRANYIAQLKTIEEDIRKISHELNADFVSGSGFINMVTELIETQAKAYGLNHEFKHDDDISWDVVPNKTKINSYRIIQESMQNIYKHANAKTIKISISLEKDVICLTISDDGDGFDTSKSKKGIGLKNMSSRVADIEGTIAVSSEINQGTTVIVKIPYLST